jgi:hypothetical protein
MGLREEPNAIEAYINYHREKKGVDITVSKVGLCVPNWCRKIGASPDGIVSTPECLVPHILEVKCLYDTMAYPRSILQIAKDRGPRFYCYIDDGGKLQLKKTHAYYYQLLGEMITTGLLTADFVIYHPRTAELKILRIPFDDCEWRKLKVKLDNFTAHYL